jgi:hypothetical protein
LEFSSIQLAINTGKDLFKDITSFNKILIPTFLDLYGREQRTILSPIDHKIKNKNKLFYTACYFFLARLQLRQIIGRVYNLFVLQYFSIRSIFLSIKTNIFQSKLTFLSIKTTFLSIKSTFLSMKTNISINKH